MQTDTVYMTTKEAANYLKNSYKTWEKWRAEGRGPDYVRLENGRILYKKRDIDDWVQLESTQSVIQ